MSKQPDQKVKDRALKLHEDGKSLKEIMQLTELNYSQLWALVTDANLDPKMRVKGSARTAVKVKQLREKGYSWGLIAVCFGIEEYPESKIRKMFEEASGLKSQGLRIGRGGRYLNRDPRFYVDDHRHPGTEIPSGTPRSEFDDLAKKVSNGQVKPKMAPGQKATGTVKKAAAKKAPAKKRKAVAKKKAPVKKATGRKADPFDE